MEVTTTRHNPNVFPELEVWHWDVALYLFFSGLAAGALIITALAFLYAGERKLSREVRASALVAAIVVPVAMLGLFSDLANKANIFAFYRYWNFSSTMALGARALLVIPPVGVLFGLSLLPELIEGRLKRFRKWMSLLEPHRVLLARLTLACGAFLGIYTGILLSANFGRPIWNTPMVPVLFLVSGLSTGAAAMSMATRDHLEKEILTKLDVALITAELAVLVLMLVSATYTTRSQHEALRLFVGGPFTAAFWVVVGMVGLIVPLFLERLELKRRIPPTALPSLMVLVGGLGLRVIIVFAGQASTIPN